MSGICERRNRPSEVSRCEVISGQRSDSTVPDFAPAEETFDDHCAAERAGARASASDPAAIQFCCRHSQAQSRCRPRRQACFHRSDARLDLWRARRSRRTLRSWAAGARAASRRARAFVSARHHRLADGLSGRHQGRDRAGASQHAAHRRRLPLHARGQPRQAPRRVRGALSQIRQGAGRVGRSAAGGGVGERNAPSCVFRGAPGRRCGRTGHRADRLRRHLLLALYLGLDRQAQSRGAHPCRR